ncbi:MAG: peptidase domain protein, partial [Phycisphaerales bacterium]|nr:peptidase domain protein [Phycisphaerales bacterium]
EVRVEAEGLPGDLTCGTTTIPAGESVGSLVVSAGNDASGWCGPVRIVARAKVNDAEITREARIGAVVWPSNQNTQEPAISRLAQDFTLAVSGDEKEPLTFEVGDRSYEVMAGGKVQIAVKVRRNMEIKTPLKVKPGGLSAMNNAKEMTIAPEATEGLLEIDLSQQKLSPGIYTFFLQTQAQVKYERKDPPGADKKEKPKKNARDAQVNFYSPPITLNVLAKDKPKDK